MKLLKLMLIFVLLSFPLALATFTLDTDSSYATGSTVTFSGTCDEDDQVALQLNTDEITVWVGQETIVGGTFSTTYNPIDENYTLYSSCGSSLTNMFCVGVGCTEEIGDNGNDAGGDNDVGDGADAGDDGGAGSSSSSSSSSSGGGRGSSQCDPEWSCGAWSYCTSELIQTRTCQDLNFCYDDSTMPETEQSCDECLESWVCTTWG